jgi:hypothetical protein
MDYPQLNLLFGLLLVFTVVVNVAVRVLLSKASLPVGLSLLSWASLIISILSAAYIELLFLRLMTPSFNRQIELGLLLIGCIGAPVTISLSRKALSARITNILIITQLVAGLITVVLAFGLYRSMVPV